MSETKKIWCPKDRYTVINEAAQTKVYFTFLNPGGGQFVVTDSHPDENTTEFETIEGYLPMRMSQLEDTDLVYCKPLFKDCYVTVTRG